MKKLVLLILAICIMNASQQVFAQLKVSAVGVTAPLGFNTDGGVAEITAYDPITKQLFCVNGAINNVAYFDFSNPQSASPLNPIGTFTIAGAGSINSIACYNGLLAIVYENGTDRTLDGSLQLYTTSGLVAIGSPITVGRQPDMVTFSPDGKKILVANEGEPNNFYTVDPEGSVSIIDVTDPNSPIAQTVSLTSLNGTIPHLASQPTITPSIRIFGVKNSMDATAPGFALNNVKTPSTVAEDLEPEYITISPDGNTAWVTCQENNAVLIINIPSASLTTIVGLGYKDHNLAGNGMDISRTPTNTNAVSISRFPLKGMYQPDGISVHTIAGVPYLFTANEGDARAYAGFNEELDINAAFGARMNSANFSASQISAITAAGIRITTVMGNTNGGNPFFQTSLAGANINAGNNYEEIYTYGSRSFSIWNGLTGQLVWDSGEQLERITLNQYPLNFNADHNGGSGNNVRRRSTTKGPEPESIVTTMLGDSLYTFVALERIGGVVVFNVTNPNSPYFRQYINMRNFAVTPVVANAATVGDLGPEGLLIIKANESPDGKNYLVVSNEVSGTIRILLLDYSKGIVKSAPKLITTTATQTEVKPIILDGANLPSPITLDAPSGFELSLMSTSGFGAMVTVTNSGVLSNLSVYIRYTGSAGSALATITISSGYTSMSFTPLTLFGVNLSTTTGSAAYTLQLLHASDFEAGLAAMDNAPKFTAIWGKFDAEYSNTLRVSGGDNFLPSPFFNAGADGALRDTYRQINNSFLGGTNGGLFREGIGRADINLMNLLNLHASAIGNHEFDAGTGTFAEMININYNNATNPTEIRWQGTLFPYLSSNLDFSQDPNLRDFYTSEIRMSSSYKTLASFNSTFEQRKKIAPATIALIGGERIGVVGATTQIVQKISSTGAVTVIGTNVDNMPLLASQLQPQINRLREQGINKVVLLSHLQQITLEKALAPLLSGVDIIVAAGSHTLMADSNDDLEGDTKADDYPYVGTDKDGNTTLIVSTANEYSYVGRLVVDFDADGKLLLSSLNSTVNGAWKASTNGMAKAGVNTTTVFGTNSNTPANLAKGLIEGLNTPNGITLSGVTATLPGIRGIIIGQDGNLFGKTAVYLEGRREGVRQQETNLGNLSSDANLWYARSITGLNIQVSIKNGGGIRAALGVVSAVGSDFVNLPPLANPSAGKATGDISQLDISNSLRFNNGLSVVTVTAAQLLQTINHAVAASGPGLTPGQFAQVGGIRYSYDLTLPAGSRIRSAAIIDENGLVTDVLAVNGAVNGNPTRTFGVVTLNFMVTGGDSYPFPAFNSANSALFNRRDVYTSATGGFSVSGYEQDAFAQYMKTFYPNTGSGYSIVDTPENQDLRIQNLGVRSESVLPSLSASALGTIAGFENAFGSTTISVAGLGLGVPITVMAPANASVNGMSMTTVSGNGGTVSVKALISTPTTYTVAVTVSAANFTRVVNVNVVGSVVTTLDKDNMNGFAIYPNPVVEGILNFTHEMSGVIINQSGVSVGSFERKNKVSVSSLTSGVYTIKFENGTTRKFVVSEK